MLTGFCNFVTVETMIQSFNLLHDNGVLHPVPCSYRCVVLSGTSRSRTKTLACVCTCRLRRCPGHKHVTHVTLGTVCCCLSTPCLAWRTGCSSSTSGTKVSMLLRYCCYYMCCAWRTGCSSSTLRTKVCMLLGCCCHYMCFAWRIRCSSSISGTKVSMLL